MTENMSAENSANEPVENPAGALPAYQPSPPNPAFGAPQQQYGGPQLSAPGAPATGGPTLPPRFVPPMQPTGPYGPQGPHGTGTLQLEQPRKKRRTRTLAAGFAAVAVLAGSAGGVAGAYAGHNSGSSPAAVAASNTAQTVANPLTGSTSTSGGVSTIAAKVLPSVVEITVQTQTGEGIGSGVILNSTGRILTNNHVVADAVSGGGTITVKFSNGKTAQAKIVGTNASADLAVIQTSGVSGLTPATLGDSSAVKVGDTVVAIGSPEGLQNTVTSGIVSYLGRDVTIGNDESQQQDQESSPYGSQQSPYGDQQSPYGDQQSPDGQSQSQSGSTTTTYKAIQTDASINPGNSGGPLVNSAGQIIGINSAIYSPSSSDGSQGGSVGLGFAIPINTAKQIIAQLVSGAQN
jgi:putative serine protease PepD